MSDIEYVLFACVRKHLYAHFQTATTDASILSGIIKVITEKKNYDVISHRTRRKMCYTIGAPFVVKPYVEEENGIIKAITTQMCRYRAKAYTCTIFIPWTETEHEWIEPDGVWSQPLKTSSHTVSFNVPIAVGSFMCHSTDGHVQAIEHECPYDIGGYFIIKGTEKIIVCPIIMQNNTPFIRCMDAEMGHWTLEYRALSDHKKRSTSTLTVHLMIHRRNAKPSIRVSVPFINVPIPVTMVLRLLGVDACANAMRSTILSSEPAAAARNQKSDEMRQFLKSCMSDVYTEMPLNDIVQKLVEHSNTPPAANESQTASRGRTVYNNFTSEFLPNMGLPGSPDYLKRKERMFGYLIWTLLQVAFGQTQDSSAAMDRDDCRYKRIEHTGGEITYLFRRAWRPYIKTVLGASHNSIENKKNLQLTDITKLTTLQSILLYAFATGNWGTEKAGSAHTGVSQQRSTLNYGAVISHVDRVASHINREGKDPHPRLLHSSQWGVYCPVESPEGDACGQIHNLTSCSHIRIGLPGDYIKPIMLASAAFPITNIADATVDDVHVKTKIIINGALEGLVEDSDLSDYVSMLYDQRSAGALAFDTSICHDPGKKTINVFTDAGASVRPVLIVSQLLKLSAVVARCRRYPHLLISSLIREGIMQYMDKDEEHVHVVACSQVQLLRSVKYYNDPQQQADSSIESPPVYTHIEVHPALIIGICASQVVYPDKNQAPRNIYGTCMTKQAGGCSTVAPSQRNDTIALRLWYPQRPLVSTSIAAASHLNDLPCGQNAIVAVLPYDGNNQEDSIEISQSSLDFGMFRTYYERTHRDDDSGGLRISAASSTSQPATASYYDDKGQPIANLKDTNYGSLGLDGIVDPGTFLQKGDCLSGKREHNASDGSTKDMSTIYRGRERAQVVSVRYVCSDAGGVGGSRKQVFIKTAAHRRPQVGDKFSSRHGQKGVCGDIISKENLPYTETGITPDLIINPHGQPSRMTVGQMIEGAMSKLQAMRPESRLTTQIDGTAFRNDMIGRDGDEHIDQLNQALCSLGFLPMGHEVMYSGITGLHLGTAMLFRAPCDDGQEQLTGDNGTCIAPMYYQSLRHVAKDKLGARQRGPYDPITMQPIDGRSRNGGLRFGEMEKDALSCYGASETLRGRLFKDSDAFPVVYCSRCYREGSHRPHAKEQQMYCKACDSYTTCVQTFLPRGMHCAMQESQAMLIGWHMKSAPVETNPFDLQG